MNGYFTHANKLQLDNNTYDIRDIKAIFNMRTQKMVYCIGTDSAKNAVLVGDQLTISDNTSLANDDAVIIEKTNPLTYSELHQLPLRVKSVPGNCVIISTTTAAVGANWTALPNWAGPGLIRFKNNSGTPILVSRGGVVPAITILDGEVWTETVITNTYEFSIKRADSSNTQVTLQASYNITNT